MALTPVEVRHIQLRRGLFGYRRSAVHGMMDDIADSFETVWRERSQLVERVEELETEVARHVELEGLLRSTLVSAEKASRDLKEAAQKEADVIVTEANAEARKVLRDAITEKEKLMGDVHRVQAVLRSALTVVDDVTADRTRAVTVPTSAPVPVPEPSGAEGWIETRLDDGPAAEPTSETRPPETAGEVEQTEGQDSMAELPIGGRSTEPPPFQLPSAPESRGEIRKLAG